jgi:hypothetical protein
VIRWSMVFLPGEWFIGSVFAVSQGMKAIDPGCNPCAQPPRLNRWMTSSGNFPSLSREGIAPPDSTHGRYDESRRQSTGKGARALRANLHVRVSLQGVDRRGTPFVIYGLSNNFSRKGLGIELERNVLHTGMAVTVDLPGRLHSAAVVRWCSCDRHTGRFRAGLRLLNPSTSVAFRGVAFVLLFVSMLCQVVHPKVRLVRSADSSCVVSMAAMKSLVDRTLGGLGYATDSEKAFLHLQHQRRSCEEYSRLFERSDYYRDEKKRNAVAAWHWRVYHAADGEERNSTIRKLETMLAEVH